MSRYEMNKGDQMSYRLVFSKDNVLIQKEDTVPLTGDRILVDLKALDYNELKSANINISVNSITPTVENGILKALTMKFDTYEKVGEEAEEEVEVEEIAEQPRIEQAPPAKLPLPIRKSAQGTTLFQDKLYKTQREKLDLLIQQINEIGDPKIYIEEHKQHVAIKYDKDRARAWLVIKASGGRHLYLWLRAGSDLHDPKHITRPYDDSSLTHGNYRVELMAVEDINDVMELVLQSLDYRRRDDYFEDYTALTRWRGRR